MLRRTLLEGMAGIIGFTFANPLVGVAAAAEEIREAKKIRKTDADYQYQPNGRQRCAICLQFEPPSKCKIIQAPISPSGWCRYFAAKENAH